MGKKPKPLAGSNNLPNREPDSLVHEETIHHTDANNSKSTTQKRPHVYRNFIADVGHAPFGK
jgi:hypothetical protein